MKLKGIKLQKITRNDYFALVILATIFLRSADLSFNVAVASGPTAIIAPIAGSYPTLFVILAFLIFKDPITRQQIAGIIMTLIGIVALSFLSV